MLKTANLLLHILQQSPIFKLTAEAISFVNRVAEVAERLGHDPATLMRYYTRINAARRQQAAHRHRGHGPGQAQGDDGRRQQD